MPYDLRDCGIRLEALWQNGGMTHSQFPIGLLVIAIILACIVAAGAVALLIGFATHRLCIVDSDEGDGELADLSDDTAALLSMMPVVSVVIDGHDEVVRSSPDAYRLGVVREGDIVEHAIIQAVHEVRESGRKRQFDLTTDTPEQYLADAGKTEGSAHRPNWLKVTVGRLNGDLVIVLLNDVSDAVRFGQIRDSFITNVSEQLLEPTKALAKLADGLEHDMADSQQIEEDARHVRSGCIKLNHMVSDLLLLIRVQEPIVPSSANRLMVMEQVRKAVRDAQPQAVAAGVALNVAGDDALVVNGQADQIAAAVNKLIENAIGYSPSGKTVNVSVERSKEGDHAVIRVIDQGLGIAKKDQARIFERFYRGAAQNERTADGVGLGLAIVKHVALTHHGDVTVWSTPGSGSTFSLTLPLAK